MEPLQDTKRGERVSTLAEGQIIRSFEDAAEGHGMLTNMWFHSFNPSGDFDWCGKIRAHQGGRCLARITHPDGAPAELTSYKLFRIEDMDGFVFFESSCDMRAAYERVLKIMDSVKVSQDIDGGGEDFESE